MLLINPAQERFGGFLSRYVPVGIPVAIGTLAAYLLVTRLMKIEWVFLPVPLLWTAGMATLLTLVLGFAGTWRALGTKAAPYLRNE